MFVALLVILCLSKQATLFYYQTKLIEAALLEMLLLHFVHFSSWSFIRSSMLLHAFVSPEILHMFFVSTICTNYVTAVDVFFVSILARHFDWSCSREWGILCVCFINIQQETATTTLYFPLMFGCKILCYVMMPFLFYACLLGWGCMVHCLMPIHRFLTCLLVIRFGMHLKWFIGGRM